MAYVSLYRKYRPQTFDDVVGQTHVTRTLANAIAEERLHHAYLFTGPRGTGKTSTARILAKAINCEEGPTATPCNVCRQCTEITEGSSVDVIELDMASHGGVDDARELRERALFSPASARKKVYILDEVHMASTAAFNALLKLIEEPPGHVMFAMATTDPQKVLPTIMSRVQRLDLRRVSAADVAGNVRQLCKLEGYSIEEGAVEAIVRAGDGSLRDTQSVLEQVLAFTGTEVTTEAVVQVLGQTPTERVAEVVDLLAERDVAGLLASVQRLVDDGHDLRRFTLDLVQHVRDLLVLGAAPDQPDLVDATAERRKLLLDQASSLPADTLLRSVRVLAATVTEQRLGSPRLPLELALATLVVPSESAQLDELTDRIARLEAGAFPAPSERDGAGARAAAAMVASTLDPELEARPEPTEIKDAPAAGPQTVPSAATGDEVAAAASDTPADEPATAPPAAPTTAEAASDAEPSDRLEDATDRGSGPGPDLAAETGPDAGRAAAKPSATEEVVGTEPEVMPVPEPSSEPVVPDPEPLPDPAPDPMPDPLPDPVPDPLPDPVPDPTPEPSPGPMPEPSPEPAPDPLPEPSPSPAPDPVPAPIPEPEPLATDLTPQPQPAASGPATGSTLEPEPVASGSAPESRPEPTLEPEAVASVSAPEPLPEASPDPAPDPGSGPVAPVGGDDLELVKERWDAVLEAIRAGSRRHHAVFVPAKPIRVGRGILTLRYGRRYASFHAANAGSGEYAAAMQEALEQTCGLRLRLEVLVEGDDERRRPLPPSLTPDDARTPMTGDAAETAAQAGGADDLADDLASDRGTEPGLEGPDGQTPRASAEPDLVEVIDEEVDVREAESGGSVVATAEEVGRMLADELGAELIDERPPQVSG